MNTIISFYYIIYILLITTMLLKHLFLLSIAVCKYADGWQDTWYDVYYHTNVKFNMIVVEHLCAVVFLRVRHSLLGFKIHTTLRLINIAIKNIMGQVQILYDIYVVSNMGSCISELWAVIVISTFEKNYFLDL